MKAQLDGSRLSDFAGLLINLRLEVGRPSYAAMYRESGFLAPATISDALRSKTVPRWEFVRAFVMACVQIASVDGVVITESGGDLAWWRQEWTRLQHDLRDEVGDIDPPTAYVSQGEVCQLPGPVEGFIGRESEFAIFDQILERSREADSKESPLVLVTGIGGVGKTSLTREWGRSRAKWFPDGRFYIDLEDTSAQSREELASALAAALIALGQGPGRRPLLIPDLTASLRNALIDKRVLMVIDGAQCAAQVRPFLSVGGGSLTMVTSRCPLRSLVISDGARQVVVKPLGRLESTNLLRSTGVDRHPAEVLTLSVACGGLPLALRIAAASFEPPSPLPAERDAGDLCASVDSIFSDALTRLPQREQALLVAAAYHPGPTFDALQLAAMTELPPLDVARGLAVLAREHLLTTTTTTGRRYRMHALVKEWAHREFADRRFDSMQGFSRLLGFYLVGVDRADRLLLRQRNRPDLVTDLPRPSFEPTLPDAAAATRWVRLELSNLVAAAEQVTGQHADFAIQLPHILMSYFDAQRPWGEWMRASRVAVSWAESAGQSPGEAAHLLITLGIVQRETGDRAGALRSFERARDHYQRAGETVGTAIASSKIEAAKRETKLQRLTGQCDK